MRGFLLVKLKRFTPAGSAHARNNAGMPCKNCVHFLTSAQAAQRAVLDGYGYCKAAPTPELRARFFSDGGNCWLEHNRYQEQKS